MSETGYRAWGIGESGWVGATEDELLPACVEHGVGVVVRVALDEGGLTGRITADSTFPEDDFRRRCFRDDRPTQVEQRVNALTAGLGIGRDELAAARCASS